MLFLFCPIFTFVTSQNKERDVKRILRTKWKIKAMDSPANNQSRESVRFWAIARQKGLRGSFKSRTERRIFRFLATASKSHSAWLGIVLCSPALFIRWGCWLTDVFSVNPCLKTCDHVWQALWAYTGTQWETRHVGSEGFALLCGRGPKLYLSHCCEMLTNSPAKVLLHYTPAFPKNSFMINQCQCMTDICCTKCY